MANLVTPQFDRLDIVGAVNSGMQTGRNFAAQRQQDRDRNQLRNLAPGIVAGDNAAFDQAAAIDPTAAAAYQASGDSQVRRMKGAIDFMDQALAANNPAAAEAAYQQVKPFLSRFGQEPPATWAEAEPKFQQAKLQLAAAQQGGGIGGVQSTYVNDQGQRVGIMRDGSTRVLGNNDAGANQQTLTIDVNGTPTQVTFDRRTGRYTNAALGPTGAPAGEAMPQGGGQAQLDQEAALGNQLIAAGVPAPTVDAILQQRAQQSIATTQAVAPAMAPLTGRRAEDQAAAVEAAKLAAQNANFGNQLSQAQALQGVETNATLDRAAGEAGIKSQAERNALSTTRTQDAQAATDLIETALQILPNATGSRLGALVDSAAAAVGRSTEGAKANAQLKTIAGQLTSKMPRMQGPQSDKDVQMYREMAGDLANENLPVETRQAAAQTIMGLQQKYLPQNQSAAPVRVNSAADYNALPSGATYIDPQGNQRRKR